MVDVTSFNDYIEFSVESGRFVINCGIIDEDAHTENIQISFLAENVEIISGNSHIKDE